MSLLDFTGGTGDQNPGGPTSGTPGNPPGGIPGTPGRLPPTLGGADDPVEYLTNYNSKFAQEPPILFRDQVLDQLKGVLIAKNKPNALLIGPAGVGKTKIAEALATMLAQRDPLLPDKLQGHVIYELPLSALVAGAGIRGQLEERIKAVVAFLSDPANHAIVFIDEIHQLVGNDESYQKIAQTLKPALARGEIKCIGATTSQEAANLMDDPALNRRFSRIIVDEFTQEQTVEILNQAKPGFFAHYQNKIVVTDDLMPAVVRIADEYRPAGSHRPDNALTLLDRAIGEAIVGRKRQEQAAQGDPALTAALQAAPLIPVTERQVRKTALKLMTGNAEQKALDMDAMRVALSRIRGQDDAIEKILHMLRQHDMNLFPRTTPATALFAGYSGVGKTEVAKIIAHELTGMKPIIVNMTEYHSPASINRIIGSPAGYVGSTSNAELPFDCLESNPYQVILLDEFEKGDRSVQRLFMSAFDEGYIKTNRGKTIDFSRAIMIATTNAGHGVVKKPLGFGANDPNKKNHRQAVAELSKTFDTELLNRFQLIVDFELLTEDTYREIVAEMYATEVARIKTSRPRIPLADAMPDDELDRIVETTFVPEFGARPARKAVRNYIESQV